MELLKLQEKLFTNYSSSSLNISVPVLVVLYLSQIIDLDEKNQILYTKIWNHIEWFDAFLTWDPSDYGNITSFSYHADEIWNPEVTVFEDVREKVRNISGFRANISHNGIIRRTFPVVMKSYCQIDVKYYPFDQQNCHLSFGSLSYNNDEVNLLPTKKMPLSGVEKNNEWQVTSINSRIKNKTLPFRRGEHPFIIYNISIKRYPTYYLYCLVLPCIVITVITIFGFLLPPTSGEKVSFGVTTLLALNVFLILVVEQMPTQSEVIPLLALYFGATMILLSVATAFNVVVLHIHHRGEQLQRMPTRLRHVIFNRLARFLFMRTAVVNMKNEARMLQKCHEEANLCRQDHAELHSGLSVSNEGSSERNLHKSDSFTSTGSEDDSLMWNDDSEESTERTDEEMTFVLNESTPKNMKPMSVPVVTCHDPEGVTSDPQASKLSPAAENILEELVRIASQMLGKVSAFEHLQLQTTRIQIFKAEWRLFAAVIDRLLFFVFFIITVSMIFLFFGRVR